MGHIRRVCRILPFLAVLSIVTIMTAFLALAKHPAKTDEPVVIISAPWVSAEALARQAGGQLIAPGRIGAIGLVWSPNPEFIDGLYEAGAWVVLDGDLSGVLCVT